MIREPWKVALALGAAYLLLTAVGVALVPDSTPRWLEYALLVGGGIVLPPAVVAGLGSLGQFADGGSRRANVVLAVALSVNVAVMTYNTLILDITAGWVDELAMVAVGGSVVGALMAAGRVVGWEPRASGGRA